MSEAQVEGKLGGWSEEKPADAQIQRLCDETKTQFEKVYGEPFSMYIAIAYISQVVAGTNYIVKVQISDAIDGYVHERIYEPLPVYEKPIEAVAIEKNKTKGDPITVFD